MTELDTIVGSDPGHEASASATATANETRERGGELQPDPIRGEVIGRYVILERLGAGAMGVVFAAYDPELDRRVALKLLNARHDSERARARLVREAQSLARVTHPRVVAVHDVGVHEGRVFLAMEYVAGQTLRSYMADAARGVDERLAVLRAAGEGLAAAHRAGLVHRDFKPDNVMIAGSGEVKVMDFGLARARETDTMSGSADANASVDTVTASSTDRRSPELTQVGAMIGTPAYMAPELLAGLPADAHSDQFAFAVTCYEVLYGLRPFAGTHVSALVLAISEGRISEPAKSRVPIWLRRVVVRGLACLPGDRWPTLDEFLQALAHDPLRARRRRWLSAATLGLAAIGGAAVAWTLAGASSGPTRCEDPIAGVEGRWSTDERERVEQALGSSPGAPTVLASLDAYASAWDQASADNCTRTHVEGVQSEQAHALRATCLRHRAAAFERLVALLGEGESLERAVEAATGLPTIADCSDADALALAPEPPGDRERDAAVERLRDELAGLDTLIEMHRVEPALALARSLVERADALAYPPLAAEAKLALARALLIDDALPEAIVELRAAYFGAMACGHARTQAEAAAELVYAIGYLQQDHARGREWADHALAIAARIDDEGPIEADVHHALGVLLEAAGDLDGSLVAYETAYALRLGLLASPHPDLARSLNAMGNTNHALGQFERSREFYQQTLDMRLALFGAEHPLVAGSRNNLAVALRDLGRLDEAKLELERSLAILERSEGGATNLPRTLTNLADLERQLGNLPRARALEQRSLALRRATVGDDHPEVADSILGLARIALAEAELAEAESLAREGLARLRRDFTPGHPEILAATLVLTEVLDARGTPPIPADP